jgi:cytoskeletal protein CcmA (bactofilin family)
MWGNKKVEPQQQPAAVPAAGDPNPLFSNPPNANSPKPAPASWEEKSMSTDASRPLPSTSSTPARLGASLHVKGEISGNEDLLIDGSVEGLVQLQDRKLTVGSTAKLTADVAAREVVVYGSVKGNLRARDRIEIKKDGSVVGDITTARIMIEDGAYFKGSIEIDRSAEKSAGDLEKPAYSRAASATTAHAPAAAAKTN